MYQLISTRSVRSKPVLMSHGALKVVKHRHKVHRKYKHEWTSSM